MATFNVVTEFRIVSGEMVKTSFNLNAMSLDHAQSKADQHLDSIGATDGEWMHVRRLDDDAPAHFIGNTGNMLCVFLDGDSQSVLRLHIVNGVLNKTVQYAAPLIVQHIRKA